MPQETWLFKATSTLYLLQPLGSEHQHFFRLYQCSINIALFICREYMVCSSYVSFLGAYLWYRGDDTLEAKGVYFVQLNSKNSKLTTQDPVYIEDSASRLILFNR